MREALIIRLHFPFLSFYPPFFFYFSEIIHLLGPNILDAIKISIFLGLFSSGFFTYLLIQKLGGSKITALGGAFLFLYSPYHIVNLYVRGDLSEFTAMSLVPLCFLTLLNLIRNPSSWNKRVAFSVSYAVIILTHNVVSLAISPLLLLFIIIHLPSEKNKNLFLLSTLGSLSLGLLLSLYFWLPVIIELKYTHPEILIGGYNQFRHHFLDPLQLFHSQWGYGLSVAGPNDGMSFEMGIGNIIITATFILISIRNLFRNNLTLINAYLIIAVCASIFLTLNISNFVYSGFPLLNFFQFPWRMLALVSFFSSVSILTLDKITDKNSFKWVAIGFLIVLELFCYARDYRPLKILPLHENYYYNLLSDRRNNVTTNSWEFYPKEKKILLDANGAASLSPSPYLPILKGDLIWTQGGPVAVLSEIKKTGFYRFRVNAETETQVIINCLWFPGWEATVNGQKQLIGPSSSYFDESALIQLVIPKGRSEINLDFRMTPIRKYSFIVTIILLAGIIIIIVKNLFFHSGIN